MQVGDEDRVDVDEADRALHLPLGALAAVEEQAIATASDHQRCGIAARGGDRATGAEEYDVEFHAASVWTRVDLRPPPPGICTLAAMSRAATTVLLAVAGLALGLAAPAAAALPKPKDEAIEVPSSIAGVALKTGIERADRAWGRRGDCALEGLQSCVYESRDPRKGSASIEAAHRGMVSSISVLAGRNGRDRYVFEGRLTRLETKEGIGLGDRGRKVAKAYPEAIRTAHKTGYLIEGRGRSYMTFQTLDRKHITGITLVDGRHQG